MSIKLNKLTKRNMSSIVGGAEACICICGCRGESSNRQNGIANQNSGKYSPGGGTLYVDDKPTHP